MRPNQPGFLYNAIRLIRRLREHVFFLAYYWRERVSRQHLLLQRKTSLALHEPLCFSLIVPVYRPRPSEFSAMLASVFAQSYPYWELVLAVADLTTRQHDRLIALAAAEPRCRIVWLSQNSGIAANSNAAIAEATGDYIGFLDQDDKLTPDALFYMARELLAKDLPEVVYSDEAQLSSNGWFLSAPHLKPDFAPELLYSQNYICHFLAVKKTAGHRLGWLRPAFDGAQDHDLLLRLSRAGCRFVHVPRILYFWRKSRHSAARHIAAKPWALEAGREAIADNLIQCSLNGTVEIDPSTGYSYITQLQPREWYVSVVIPDKNQPALLSACLTSLETYRGSIVYDLIIVDTGSDNPGSIALYQELADSGRARIFKLPGPFNFSQACNFGASKARYDYCLFLNNDVEALHPGWLEAMLGWLAIPEIGVVGAKLLYPDGKVQHAGIVSGTERGGGMHVLAGRWGGEKSFHAFLHTTRNVTAVTGACLLTRTALFRSLGGFDPIFALAYNDVDYCFRVRKAGFRIVCHCASRLLHHESRSRGPDTGTSKQMRLLSEMDLFQKRWQAELLAGDPWYHFAWRRDRANFSFPLW